jgi:streptogramin lyase
MTPSNTHPGTAARGFRGTLLLQAASGLLTARSRRRLAGRVRARPRLEGLEDRCVLSPAISEFPIPTAPSAPWGIATGPDGNLWFAERAGKIGEINPTTHAITEFPTPTANSGPVWITAGPDGNLWFTEFTASQIGMINPATHAIIEFATPTANSTPFAITAGPDGNLWFTEIFEGGGGNIGEINPTTHAITEYPLPSGGDPQGIVAGPDGNLWFTELLGNKVGMINPTTHAIAEFPVPTANAYPKGIAVGPDGNLWFTESQASQVGMINPTTHAISEFPSGPQPGSITAGPDGNLWFTQPTRGEIGEINPATHAVAEFPIPYAKAVPVGITTGPDGNLWFADNGTSSIGLATLATTSLVVTQQPPSSVTAGSPFGLTVEAEDSSGNLVTSFNGSVTAVLADYPGGATLGGTLTVTASGGVATFSGLTLNKAGSGYTLVATTSVLGEGVTNAMSVTPAAASQLVITQEPPSTVKVNTRFSMQDSIEDAYGNVVTTASGTVSVAFANNPTGATLGGTLTVTASQGVANFTNLTISKVGSGYMLKVSSSGLTSATSNPINVTKNGNTPGTQFAPAGSPATDLSLAPLVFDSPDLWDGLRFKKRSRSI